MFRYSSGLGVAAGNENEKGYLIYENTHAISSVKTNSIHFDKSQDYPIGRKWDMIQSGDLKINQKPLPDSFFNLFSLDLESIRSDNLHPALNSSCEHELIRLFPEVENSVISTYHSFIQFLKQEFNLDVELGDLSNLKVYTDDFGPCLIPVLNGNYVLPPEVPPLYLAPEKWGLLTWLINNYFSGPYPEDSHPEIIKRLNGEKFHWGSLQIDDSLKNSQTEGLVYFLLSKFIIIYEAWMFEENKAIEAPSLIAFMDLVKEKGERPWQLLY